jgi:hypothetical protein
MIKVLSVVALIFVVGVGIYFAGRGSSPDEYKADNTVLGIRGFRHQQLFASGGATEQYEVGMGEEFKVLWIVHKLNQDGQFSWHGPAGVGEGSEILKAPGDEVTGLKVLTANESGVAEFILIATGPGNKEPEMNKIIVTIK